jgi:hypothetical protein
MSTDLISELRTAMEQVPARVPPGMARAAYRRHRRRRITTRAAAAAGTAAVTGTIAAVALSGSPAPVVLDTQAGYVASRVTQALGALSSHAIMFEHVTYHSRLVDPAQPPQDQWAVGGRLRVITRTPSGGPQTDFGDDAGPRTETQVNVDYQNRTWWRSVRPELPTPPPVPESYSCTDDMFNTQPFSAPEMAAQLRTEVACGLLKAAGTGVVDGVWTVKLTGVSAGLRETYWIDTTTYLPVRIVTATADAGDSGSQADIRWLPPTAANLAKLTVPIPPGFTEVPVPSGGA